MSKQGLFKFKLFIGLGLMAALFIWQAFSFLPPEKKTNNNDKITILLDWTPNTNHIGVYVAKAQKFFAQNQLDVSIKRASGQSVEILVASLKAEFGYSYQENLTFARAAKSPLPLVSVAAVIQHNTSGFAAPVSKNILSPLDFENKKYGTFNSPTEKPTLQNIMQKYNADVNKVRFVPVAESDFFRGTQSNLFDFSWIFEGWTGVRASLDGVELYYQSLAELDDVFDYYTPIIISSEKYLKKNRGIAKRFMSALKAGYQWSVQHPDEAAKILYKTNPSLDLNLLVESSRFLSVQFISDAPSWGIMKAVVFDRYTQWLKDNNFIPQNFDNKGIFTNEFIN